jgi:site-specific DNA-methyltransferase (adenine-specific)
MRHGNARGARPTGVVKRKEKSVRVFLEERVSEPYSEEARLLRQCHAAPELSTPVASRLYFASPRLHLYHGDAATVLATLPERSVDCIVTSPPYYGQRDYGVEGQLGLEPHPQKYIDGLVAVFRQARRVLKPMGSLWVNIGDTYWSGKGRPHGPDTKQKRRRFERPQDRAGDRPWCVPKQLLLIPHRFAIAMQEDNWIVRNDNVWRKPAPTPDPVEDRCASTHEYVFHFVKQRRYYFNDSAVAVPSKGERETKAPPSVWTVSTMPSQKQHLAPFPPDLVLLPIRATCPPAGVLLDPFCGSGTALEVALALGQDRRAVGIDLSVAALEEAKALLSAPRDYC